MNKKEALRLSGFKKFPKVFKEGVPAEKCIAKVSRQWGEDDYAIYKDGVCICDKGFMYMIDEVKTYYYEAPVVEVDKLAEVLALAAEAKRQKDIEAVWDLALDELTQFDADNSELTNGAEIGETVVRPTVYGDMMAFIKKHELTESKANLSGEAANKLLDAYFNK